MSIKTALLAALALVTVVYTVAWALALRADAGARKKPTLVELAIGLLTDFIDTLGIGSYAPTTSLYKLLKLVPDEKIPGTLNVGHAIPTFAEALIFISIVEIDGLTLAALIVASMLGAWLGAGIVVRWPKRNIQLGMGVALLAAATFFFMKNMGLFPSGGDALHLSGAKLAVGCVGNFVLGALMTLGIGAYAPSMIMVSLLGMNPQAAFPIMMGSCAFLIPVACIKFIQTKRYAEGPAVGLTLGGVPGVLIAAFIVKSLPMEMLRWLVIGVVLYTAVMMLRSAFAKDAA